MKKLLKCAGLVLVSGFLVLAMIPATMAMTTSVNELGSIAIDTNSNNCTINLVENDAQGTLTAAGSEAMETKETAIPPKIPCLSSGFPIASSHKMTYTAENVWTLSADEAVILRMPFLGSSSYEAMVCALNKVAVITQVIAKSNGVEITWMRVQLWQRNNACLTAVGYGHKNIGENHRLLII